MGVRTNAICMILHVLARPGAAPIGFQLSADVFCLLFWLRHGRHAGASETGGRRKGYRQGRIAAAAAASSTGDAKGNYFP